MQTFGGIIKEARKRSGFTLDQVAKSVSTHKGYVSGVENHKVDPPAANLTRRLARKLGLDPEEMVALGWFEKRPQGVTMDSLIRTIGKYSAIVLLCHSCFFSL